MGGRWEWALAVAVLAGGCLRDNPKFDDFAGGAGQSSGSSDGAGDGDGTFGPAAPVTDLGDVLGSTSAQLLDANGDGDLDVFAQARTPRRHPAR